MYDIYTPVGSPVATWATCESSLQTRQAFDDQYTQSYPNTQKIITYDNLSSTRKFNCHGYAWLRVEQGIDRWIGPVGQIQAITQACLALSFSLQPVYRYLRMNSYG
jgi:hypothetical protein